MSEGILAWLAEQDLGAELGGSEGVLRMLLRVLLVAGAKSFTHMITALERYSLVLQTLLAQTGPQVRRKSAILSPLASFLHGLPWVPMHGIDAVLLQRGATSGETLCVLHCTHGSCVL